MSKHRPSSLRRRLATDRGFQVICVLGALVAVGILATLLTSIGLRGLGRLDWAFVTDTISADPSQTGIGPALAGSIAILLVCAVSAIPLGVATAILLEEYRPKSKLLRVGHGFVQNNITNLAGVPSIVYGILGFTVFVMMFRAFGSPNDPALDIGQDFYLEYPGAGSGTFLVPANEDVELTPLAAGTTATFYATLEAAENRGPAADVDIVDPAELEGASKRIDDLLYAVNTELKDALRAVTVDRKARIDEATAQQMAADLIVPVRDQLASDPAAMREAIAGRLIEMDGLGTVEQIVKRRDIRSTMFELEFAAAGLADTILVGTTPLLKDVKHWYYLQFPFGKGVLAGGLTLMLVILPIIIVSSQEAIRAVSNEMRFGVLALGGTKWQAIEKVVLPAAIPGTCTGAILALSRAIGEAAPILLIGYATVHSAPDNLMGAFAALPLQIFNWSFEPDKDFRAAAAAGIIVLLLVLLTFNAFAVFIRQKYTQKH